MVTVVMRIFARSATSVGLAYESSCLFFVCFFVSLFVTVLGSIPGRLSQWGHALAYGSFDAKIINLLFLTKNEPVSNRLADK